MSSCWVVNASPLIALAKIEQVALLERLADAVLVPEAVRREVLAGPAGDPARLLLTSGWGQQLSPPHIPQEVTEWGLGPG